MPKRFIIEGEWSGYRASQAKIVHREAVTDSKLIAALKGHYGITYTDGTLLLLSIREAKPREVVKPVDHGYGSLIRKCAWADKWSVTELNGL
jgi:hypothetical protein